MHCWRALPSFAIGFCLANFGPRTGQSLTFIGERHQISLRVPGPDADNIVERLTAGIEDAEFPIAGHLVADITLAEPPLRNGDGSISVEIEALTIAE